MQEITTPAQDGLAPGATEFSVPEDVAVRVDETTSTGLHRLAFLDGLRGFAALYVVISHVWDTIFTNVSVADDKYRTLTAVFGFGRYAVALFIVISGFSLGLTAWRHGLRWPGGTATYLRRRFTRIYPPYLVAVLLSSLLAATILHDGPSAFYDPANNIRLSGVVTHLLLLQDFHWGGPAGSTAFWSIAIEFHIYFFFLVLLWVMRKRPGAWLWTYLGLVAVTALSSELSGAAAHHVAVLYPSLYGLFVLGFVGARGIAARESVDTAAATQREVRRALIALLAVGVLVNAICINRVTSLGPLNDLWLGPLAALLVLLLAEGTAPRLLGVVSSRIGLWLGDCSYSLYLVHAVMLELMWRLAVRDLDVPILARFAVLLVLGIAASLVAARILYRLVERPLLVRKERGRATPPPPAPAAPEPVAPAPVAV
jgi:peptidoglycan/LPS O-acetylase OafA/YrhL